MSQKNVIASLALFSGFALLFLTAYTRFPGSVDSSAPVPDFGEIEQIKERKLIFLDYMYALVETANQDILRRRARIKQVDALLEGGRSPGRSNLAFLAQTCDDYKLSCEAAPQDWLPELLNRVDMVPPSLALAQAANESAWGTSRFARQGNSFFGQWCFEPGCGMVPAARQVGKRHEVKAFTDPLGSVRSYMRNLNTSQTYYHFRHLRHTARQKASHPSGLELAGGLLPYSVRGQGYVDEIRQIIRSNKLENYDARFWQLAEQSK